MSSAHEANTQRLMSAVRDKEAALKVRKEPALGSIEEEAAVPAGETAVLVYKPLKVVLLKSQRDLPKPLTLKTLSPPNVFQVSHRLYLHLYFTNHDPFANGDFCKKEG